MGVNVPEISIGSKGQKMPVIGMGTASYTRVDAETIKTSAIEAIKAGYRHFDTSMIYGSEEPIGQAVTEALNIGLIKSRDELFISSKLWCSYADKHLVLPAIKSSLRNLGLEYLDLFLIHWPLKLSQEASRFPFPKEDIFPMDMKSVWEGMEECQVLGLTKAIGVCNFSSRRLEDILSFAKIPPVVNQVEMNPFWQQKELREYCKRKNIVITAYSPLGSHGTNWRENRVLDSPLLQEISASKAKTTAQVALRWVHEQGVALLTKSFNADRMRENLDIFDWSLTKEELENISQLPQCKGLLLSKLMEPHDLVLQIDSEI